MSEVALVAGLHFDRPLWRDLSPLAPLLAAPLNGGALQSRLTRMNLQGKRGEFSRRDRKFDLKKATEAVASGNNRALWLAGDTPTDDANLLGIHIQIAPEDELEVLGGRESTPDTFVHFRYEASIELGASRISGSEADALIDGIVDCAARLELVVGVIEAHPSIAAARALAVAAEGSGVPDDIAAGLGQLWGARWDWGPFARPPGWGTFLSVAHADQIGGREAITGMVAPYRIVETDSFVFLQLTPYADATTSLADERLSVLKRIMSPLFATDG